MISGLGRRGFVISGLKGTSLPGLTGFSFPGPPGFLTPGNSNPGFAGLAIVPGRVGRMIGFVITGLPGFVIAGFVTMGLRGFVSTGLPGRATIGRVGFRVTGCLGPVRIGLLIGFFPMTGRVVGIEGPDGRANLVREVVGRWKLPPREGDLIALENLDGPREKDGDFENDLPPENPPLENDFPIDFFPCAIDMEVTVRMRITDSAL